MMFEKEKVEKHYLDCKKDAQKCKICKPYVNGIIEATKEMCKICEKEIQFKDLAASEKMCNSCYGLYADYDPKQKELDNF